MKATLLTIASVIILILFYNFTAYRDVEILKKAAPEFIKVRGYKIISYDGYEGSVIHGGIAWYQVRDSANYLYSFGIGEWRGEIMIYNQTCLNAVKNIK